MFPGFLKYLDITGKGREVWIYEILQVKYPLIAM
jgi:hypothetical protein